MTMPMLLLNSPPTSANQQIPSSKDTEKNAVRNGREWLEVVEGPRTRGGVVDGTRADGGWRADDASMSNVVVEHLKFDRC